MSSAALLALRVCTIFLIFSHLMWKQLLCTPHKNQSNQYTIAEVLAQAKEMAE
jgi:hypothetical protein